MRNIVGARLILAFFLLGGVALCASDEQAPPPEGQASEHASVRIERHVYKRPPQADLAVFIHFPQAWQPTDQRPAMVFFFGGGFRTGKIDEFTRHADYFARRGMITARADYRVKDRHDTMPDKCVEDAKSAIRWLRGNADKYGIDPQRIVAAGHSAGGCMAACTATTVGLEAAGEDLSISSRPNLLVLYSSALDIHWKYAQYLGSEETADRLSPFDNLGPEIPPTILFYGMEDRGHLRDGLGFAYKSGKLGNTVELYAADGQSHNFHKVSPWFERTLYLTDQFLARQGYLTGEPAIGLPQGEIGMNTMTSSDFSLLERLNHTPLHIAAQSGDKERVRALIADGMDLNVKNQWGETALYTAAFLPANTEVVQTLIDAGATDPVLAYAAYYGYADLVTRFIAKGLDVNSQDENGLTALHYAIWNNDANMVGLLIDKGADVNSQDKHGLSPLCFAIQYSDVNMVDLLIAKGANIDARDEATRTPLWYAEREDHTDMVYLLLAKGADTNTTLDRPWTPLHLAIKKGDQDQVALLLGQGADVTSPGYRGQTPIETAMLGKHAEIVALLLSKGASVSALHLALFSKDKAKARALIEGGANVNERTPYGTSPLQRAIRAGFADITLLLIEKGADVNAKDNWGWSTLHDAVFQGQTMVRMLIDKGAEVNVEDGSGRTPLSYAKEEGHSDIVETLTEAVKVE